MDIKMSFEPEDHYLNVGAAFLFNLLPAYPKRFRYKCVLQFK